MSHRYDRLERLEHVIEHAGHLLPAQGPITVFVHHNTLHAFEDLPFDEGVKAGSRIFGCHPYLPEDRYRQELARGRIRVADLAAVLVEDLGDQAEVLIGSLGTRYHLRLAMLQYPLRLGPPEELRWFIAETDALTRVRRDVSPEMRERLIDETRRWVMRDVRSGRQPTSDSHVAQRGHGGYHREVIADLLQSFGESSIERWSESSWETLSLQALVFVSQRRPAA